MTEVRWQYLGSAWKQFIFSPQSNRNKHMLVVDVKESLKERKNTISTWFTHVCGKEMFAKEFKKELLQVWVSNKLTKWTFLSKSERWACTQRTHIHKYIHINPGSSPLCAKGWCHGFWKHVGGGVGGFGGDSFGPFKFAGGVLGLGRVDSTRAGGATLPPPRTPPQQAVTLGTLRPRHQRPGSRRVHIHTHLHLHAQ